jgi:hypothetical protein
VARCGDGEGGEFEEGGVALRLLLTWRERHRQEARNIVWISECIAQKNKSKVDNYVNLLD